MTVRELVEKLAAEFPPDMEVVVMENRIFRRNIEDVKPYIDKESGYADKISDVNIPLCVISLGSIWSRED